MAQWIWKFGDYEIFHKNLLESRRQEYGMDYPPMWNESAVMPRVEFTREIDSPNGGYINVHFNGIGHVRVGLGFDRKTYSGDVRIEIPAGKNKVQLEVMNLCGLPAAFVESDIWPSDSEWTVALPGGGSEPAGTDAAQNDPSRSPEIFPFAYKEVAPVSSESVDGGVLYDFGNEQFGYILIDGANPSDRLYVGYGESREEALDVEKSIIFEYVSGAGEYKLVQRAFRYIFIRGGNVGGIRALHEYLPLEYKGRFACDKSYVADVWNACAYTYHLNCREMLLDGIKRDRWVWGGDAYQSYRTNDYLFADPGIVRRTILALRGGEPFVEHVNTITDYTFMWIISLYDYYMSFADEQLIRYIYPKAVEVMDFSAKRVNDDGFIVGKGNDWIFIDWSPMDKTGAVCAEQVLWIEANRTMAKLAAIVGEDGSEYSRRADEMATKLNKFYWDADKGAFIDSYESGKRSVTRHANIFAVMYDIATPEQTQSILKNVLLNDEITKITTPYFEGFELDVMGKLGQFGFIEDKLENYWKAMLDLGATTIWEEFDPTKSGVEHYQMYADKYGKSLCHAWGAGPIYLLGRYYLGVRATSPGGRTFEVAPQLGGFERIDGVVPMNGGEVSVKYDGSKMTVRATVDGGTLVWGGGRIPLRAGEAVVV